MVRTTSLVTGASSGIGATYADRLARRGNDVLLVARDRDRLDMLAARLAAAHDVRAEVLPADLANADDLALVETRLRGDPSIGLLVNNAGLAYKNDIATADPDRLETLIRVNVIALTRLSAAASAAFVPQRRGTIVNIGSVTALLAESFEPTYLASKAYVLAFTQALHHRLVGFGIKVQAVLPGVTRTEIWDRSGNDLSQLPPETVMEVGDMVDAALSGLDAGEIVTIPALADVKDWAAFEQARLRLAPNLNGNRPAARYGIAAAAMAALA